MSTEHAALAGGCLWGMQDLTRKLPELSRHASGLCQDP